MINVEDHLNLVKWRVKYWVGRYNSPLISIDDLMSEGYVALLQAAKYYDPIKGKFSTYAVFIIDQRIISFVSKNISSFTTPAKYSKAKLALEHKRSVYNESEYYPDYTIDRNWYEHDILQIKDGINKLPRRLRGIIKDRLRGLTLKQVGDSRKISKERVRQLESKAHTQLRNMLEGAM